MRDRRLLYIWSFWWLQCKMHYLVRGEKEGPRHLPNLSGISLMDSSKMVLSVTAWKPRQTRMPLRDSAGKIRHVSDDQILFLEMAPCSQSITPFIRTWCDRQEDCLGQKWCTYYLRLQGVILVCHVLAVGEFEHCDIINCRLITCQSSYAVYTLTARSLMVLNNNKRKHGNATDLRAQVTFAFLPFWPSKVRYQVPHRAKTP